MMVMVMQMMTTVMPCKNLLTKMSYFDILYRVMQNWSQVSTGSDALHQFKFEVWLSLV